MLTELNIRNFAIIDELRVAFHAGFNVLTGETGAGKSIILDAIMLVLGGRADTSIIRAGATTAFVEASFSLNGATKKTILPLLSEEGLDEEGNNHLFIARELRENGRNICRVNGRSVNLTVLRQIAAPLIDIHGQGDHLSLLKPRSHLPLLDAYAGLNNERRTFAQTVRKQSKLQTELNSLQQDERDTAQRVEMLQFQIKEIDAANLQEKEEAELREERTRLANSEQLMRHASEAVTLLTGMDNDGDQATAVADLLGQTERGLIQLARYDETQGSLLEQLQGLIYQLSELSSDLQSYLDKLEFNPSRLDFIEERIELIQTLKRKYGEDIPAILALRDKATAQLDKISHSEERIAELQVEMADSLHKLGALGQTLSQKRKVSANKLATAIEAQLDDLSMSGARFEVDFQEEADANGAFVGSKRLSFDQTGIDKVAFLISTNPGEPLKPMAKVASGGETARLMLALKTALAQVDGTPTLIFDEIDQGIGGRIGDVVGRKLWGLTAVANHQVVVVTHLPQLAGYGDIHFHVSKAIKEGRTITAVSELGHIGRVEELADMLGTQIVHARGGAESILQEAAKVKNSRSADAVGTIHLDD